MSGEKRNTKNHAVLTKLDKKSKKVFIPFVVLLIVIELLLTKFIWDSKANAQSLYDFAMLFVPVFGGEVICCIIASVKRCKYTRRILLWVAVAFLFTGAQASWAKEVLTEEETGTDSPGGSDSEEDSKEYLDFIWEEDLYIVSWTSYCNISDEREAVDELIESYAKKYLSDDSGVTNKSEDELNQGVYGECIANAGPAEEALEKEITDEAKRDYIDLAIKWREKADEEYEEYDNKKILGNLYLKKAELPLEEMNGDKDLLEDALEYYIEALPLAYLRAEDNVIESIWRSIRDTYKRLGDVKEGVDEGHKKRIPMLIDVCDKWCGD